MSAFVMCYGPEFVSRALLKWVTDLKIDMALIDPGKPWQNGACESFNGKFRMNACGIMAQAHQFPGWAELGIAAQLAGMEDPVIVTALRDKRADIHGQIAAYEARIAQAKHDLAHVNATLRLFTDVDKQRARYVVSHGFFRKGEIANLCAQQLADGSELTTRALAERVMCARDLEATDATLRNSVVFKVVQALRHAARRKLVVVVEKRGGMCVWAAGPAITLRPANSPSTRG